MDFAGRDGGGRGTDRLRVTVVGLGLLGGSVALALKGRQPEKWRVTGVAREETTLRQALAMGAIDDGATDVAAGAAGADLVVLATPVGVMAEMASRCGPVLAPGAVVTDVGSTKAELARTVPSLLPPGVRYVGGHPMAGSERAGLGAADPDLFENAVWVLTPRTEAEPGLDRVLQLVEVVGAEPLLMEPVRHDRIVAAVSHLPHIVAAALATAVGEAAEDDPVVYALAAGGFRDTTRIASSDPALWRDIFLSNRGFVAAMVERFEAALGALKGAFAAGDGDELADLLARARTIREQLPRRRQGILRRMCEIVVQLPDEPGGISKVTGCIAKKYVNIKEIEVLRVREGEAGVLRLGFETEADVDVALGALTEAGFPARRRG